MKIIKFNKKIKIYKIFKMIYNNESLSFFFYFIFMYFFSFIVILLNKI
jgi:hypothetical protein